MAKCFTWEYLLWLPQNDLGRRKFSAFTLVVRYSQDNSITCPKLF